MRLSSSEALLPLPAAVLLVPPLILRRLLLLAEGLAMALGGRWCGLGEAGGDEAISTVVIGVG